MADLLVALAEDVNQQEGNADRAVDRDLLGKWAGAHGQGESDECSGPPFNPMLIYHDDERQRDGEFAGLSRAAPEEGNEFQPFLSPMVALRILARVFVTK